MMSFPNVNRNRVYLHLLLLAVVSFAVFGQALGHDFLINWDDRQYILDNPVIRGFSPDHLKTAFTTFYVGNYAPLHLISYMLDYQIRGMHPSGFIFTNLLLHTVNGLLFYLLLRRLAGDKVWILPAALLFLLHPVQVESVVWISQRKNVLAMAFFLGGIYSYSVYAVKEGMWKKYFYFLSLFLFLFALLTKSVAVVMPLALILYDLSFREKREFKSLLVDKVPFLAVAAVFCIVTVKSQSFQFQGGETSYHGGTPYATFLTMMPVLVHYLRLLVWPAGLSAVYDVPIKTGIDLEVFAAAVVCAVLIIIGIGLYRRRRDIFFWFALFFVGLIPVSQIVPIVTLMNDRYLYFPMLGAAAFMGIVIFRDMKWNELTGSPGNIALSACCLLIVGAYGAAAFQRVGVWQNSAALWGDAVQKAPKLALTHDCFGEGLLQEGRIDEAINQLRIAISLEPDVKAGNLSPGGRNAMANTRNNLGTAYGMKGMTDAAIDQFIIAIQLNPDLAKAYFNLGNALMHKSLVAEALRCFENAARLEPGNPSFAANLSMTREIMERGEMGKPSMSGK